MQAGVGRPGNSSDAKALGILVGSKESVSAGNPAAQEADCDLGCPHEAVKQLFEESHNTTSGCSIQFWTPQYREDMDIQES